MNAPNIQPVVHLFGIPNCDSVKKARVWLDANGICYDFQDFKKTPLTQTQLEVWCKQIPWEQLINKTSTTWRGLTKSQQSALTDQQSACKLMLEQPSLVKRPVIWSDSFSQVIVGVQPEMWGEVIA